MSNIYFSVVIPSYNQKSFLEKAIDSVLSQTYKNFEIIVVDNNSNDSSQEYIQRLRNKKIKLIRTENFGSIAKSRNIGIEKSEGNWISFLDSDDFWHPKKLEIVKEEIDKNNFEMISHDEYNVDRDDVIISKSNYGFKRKNTLKYLMSRGNLYSTSTITISRKFLNENNLYFDERLSLATTEDYDFWIRLTINKIKVTNINKNLGFYRIHHNSASQNIIKHLNASLFVKRKNLEYVIENNLFNNLDTLEIIIYYWIYKFYVTIKTIIIYLTPKR
tara:strand:+ start:5955 stop:6776 length:822 start_codon:yes stop_codon:yes gene_type:complete